MASDYDMPAVPTGGGDSSNGNGAKFGTPDFSDFGGTVGSTESQDAKTTVQSRADECK